MTHHPHLLGDVAVHGVSFSRAAAVSALLERVSWHYQIGVDIVLLKIGVPLAASALLNFVIVAETVQCLFSNVDAPDKKLLFFVTYSLPSAIVPNNVNIKIKNKH